MENLLNNYNNIIAQNMYYFIKDKFKTTDFNYLNISTNQNRYALYDKNTYILDIFENNVLLEMDDSFEIDKVKIFKLMNDTVDYPEQTIIMTFKNLSNLEEEIYDFNIGKILHIQKGMPFDYCFKVITPFENYSCDNTKPESAYQILNNFKKFIGNINRLSVIDRYYYFCDETGINGLMYIFDIESVDTGDRWLEYYLELPNASDMDGYVMDGGIILFVKNLEFNYDNVKCRFSVCCGHPDVYFNGYGGWCYSHGDFDFPNISPDMNHGSLIDTVVKILRIIKYENFDDT